VNSTGARKWTEMNFKNDPNKVSLNYKMLSTCKILEKNLRKISDLAIHALIQVLNKLLSRV
jgi:hypothetical protein